jgi:hypothetical protein
MYEPIHAMSLENRDQKTSAELLAEMTGRPVEDFELPDDLEIPDLEDLTEVDADEFYSEE